MMDLETEFGKMKCDICKTEQAEHDYTSDSGVTWHMCEACWREYERETEGVAR